MEILLATDGSIEAELAEAVVQKLPLPEKTVIHVAMAVPPAPLLFAGIVHAPFPGAADGAASAWRAQKNMARQTVDKVSERIRRTGFDVEGHVLEGEIADELSDVAEKTGCDLVVTGSGTNSELASFFLGSVSRTLALNSRASILIGRHYRDTPAEGSYKKIDSKKKLDVLLAVDGSPGSQLAIESLQRLRRKVFGRIMVLAVEPLRDFGLASGFAEIPVVDTNESWGTQIAQSAADKIRGCCDQVESCVGMGRPSIEIGRVASLEEADIIMLGANRHGLLERLLLGSCAYETSTSAPCSVLVFRNRLELE